MPEMSEQGYSEIVDMFWNDKRGFLAKNKLF